MDALIEASADQTEKRADEWQRCLTQPGDYPGQLTPTQHLERDAMRAAITLALRRRASLLRQRRVRL